MRAAGRVGLPLTAGLKPGLAAASTESTFQILEMEPAPVTNVVLEVPLQSDVLLELLDQQIPRPDWLYELASLRAHTNRLRQWPVRATAAGVTLETHLSTLAVVPAGSHRELSSTDEWLAEVLRRSAAGATQFGSPTHGIRRSIFKSIRERVCVMRLCPAPQPPSIKSALGDCTHLQLTCVPRRIWSVVQADRPRLRPLGGRFVRRCISDLDCGRVATMHCNRLSRILPLAFTPET